MGSSCERICCFSASGLLLLVLDDGGGVDDSHLMTVGLISANRKEKPIGTHHEIKLKITNNNIYYMKLN